MAKPLARSVLFAASLFGAATSVTAQSPAETFREAVRALRATEVDRSLELLRSLDPDSISPEDATAIWKAASEADFVVLMGEGGEFAALADKLLRRARPANVDRSRDADGIAEAVALAVSSTAEAHTEGLRRIRSEYGEFAVPALLHVAADPNAGARSDVAIVCLIRLGNEAVPALTAALRSDNLATRSAAILALGPIGDRRAAPALAGVAATDPSQSLRTAARRALKASSSVSGNPAKLHLGAARQALALDSEQLIPSSVVWSLEGGELVARDVPAELYYSEVAKDHALQALELRPGSEDALAVLKDTYKAQLAMAGEVSLDEDVVAALQSAAFALGADEASSVELPGDVAFQGAGLEADLSLADLNALAVAPNLAVRYEAATRLAFSISSKDEVLDAPALVDTLRRAVQQESVHTLLVVDPSEAVLDLAAEAAAIRGVQLSVASDEVGAVQALNSDRLIDLVLVSANTPKAATVARFCRNAGARNVLIHTFEELSEEASAEFEASELEVVEVPADVDVETFRGLVVDTLGEFDEDREVPNKIALAGAAALVQAGKAGIDVAAAGDALARQLDRSPEIASQMAQALGYAGSARHVGALLDLATAGDTLPERLRQASAESIGWILKRTQSAEATRLSVEPLLALAESQDIDLGLRQAAATALGRAPLNAEWRARVAAALDASAGSR